jgi:hypothetical protein
MWKFTPKEKHSYQTFFKKMGVYYWLRVFQFLRVIIFFIEKNVPEVIIFKELHHT